MFDMNISPISQPIDLLKRPRAIAAGVVYLQDEKYTFLVHEGGKEWSVYGSPVRHSFISPSSKLDFADA
jgi:hypothetical protein